MGLSGANFLRVGAVYSFTGLMVELCTAVYDFTALMVELPKRFIVPRL